MRDDFDERTKDILARRVSLRCSNPICRQPTSGPQIDPTKAINIGVAAHIKAASPGGKRYDVKQTSAQRKSIENGIWLCQSCSKLIDSDETKYTFEILQSWKLQAEKIALRELEEKEANKVSTTIVVRYAESDKDFALWLSLQLISRGYPIWCNLLNSEPGVYTQAYIRNLVKNKTAKFLFVLSSSSNRDSELQKELRFAYEVMQSKRLEGFVVPVQIVDISDNERTILLQGTSPIDFSHGWSIGLNGLLSYFENSNVTKDIKCTPSKANDLWRLQYSANKGLKNEHDELISNWFPIRLPETLYFHELKRSCIGLLTVQAENLPFPAIQHNIYLVTFAKAADFSGKLGKDIFIQSTFEIKLKDFLDGDYDQKLARVDLAWGFVTELLNDAWNRFILLTRLKIYILANNRLCYYFPIGFTDNNDNKVFFQGVNGKRTWRILAGKHKNNFWHYGIQGRVILHPEPALIIKSHGLVSSDGVNIWTSKEKLHTARRKWFKNWWNAAWRDRLLAAICFLASQREFIDISLGADVVMSVSSSPVVFLSPFSYINPRDALDETEVDDECLTDDDEYDGEFDDTPEEYDS